MRTPDLIVGLPLKQMKWPSQCVHVGLSHWCRVSIYVWEPAAAFQGHDSLGV